MAFDLLRIQLGTGGHRPDAFGGLGQWSDDRPVHTHLARVKLSGRAGNTRGLDAAADRAVSAAVIELNPVPDVLTGSTSCAPVSLRPSVIAAYAEIPLKSMAAASAQRTAPWWMDVMKMAVHGRSGARSGHPNKVQDPAANIPDIESDGGTNAARSIDGQDHALLFRVFRNDSGHRSFVGLDRQRVRHVIGIVLTGVAGLVGIGLGHR